MAIKKLGTHPYAKLRQRKMYYVCPACGYETMLLITLGMPKNFNYHEQKYLYSNQRKSLRKYYLCMRCSLIQSRSHYYVGTVLSPVKFGRNRRWMKDKHRLKRVKNIIAERTVFSDEIYKEISSG